MTLPPEQFVTTCGSSANVNELPNNIHFVGHVEILRVYTKL